MPIADYFSRRPIILEFSDGTSERIRIRHRVRPTPDDRFHTILEGDTLSSIAFRFYREPKAGVVIADVNNIIDPFDLTIGDTLIIPPRYVIDGRG